MFQLNRRAQDFAEHLVSLGKLRHGEHELSGGHRVGENLYGGMGDSHSYTVASVDAWYSEVEEYRDGLKSGPQVARIFLGKLMQRY